MDGTTTAYAAVLVGPLRAAVAGTCAALGAGLSLPAADAVADVARRAGETPSLVVTGPVSSGKSTLVNALVGRRVAPTGAGECTRLVARYVRGPVDRLDVVLVDGTRRPLPLAPGGRVPAAVGDRLGVHPADVDHLLVTLTSAALDGLTVVDTPGTGSARGHEAQRSWTDMTGHEAQRSRPDGTGHEAQRSRPRRRGHEARQSSAHLDHGPGAADAALVVLPATAHSGDLDALGGHGTAVADGPAGVVAVLGRADTVGTDDGAAVSADLGQRLGGRLGAVTPVIGLLAETAITGALRIEDVRALASLAAADPEVLEVALLDPELFTTAELPVAPAVRAGLLELLDRRGIGLAVTRLRAEPDAGVGEIRDVLLAASGLDRLIARLDEEIRARIDLLAARSALRRLETLARSWTRPYGPARGGGPDEATRTHDAAAELRRRGGFDGTDLLAVRARMRSGALAVPDELVDEVTRLAAAGPTDHRLGREATAPMELAAHAARRAAWWRSYASWGTPRPLADAAHVVHRTYLLLWRELTGS